MKNLRLLFLLITFVILSSCSSDPMAEGDKLYQEGQYAKSLKKYHEAIKAQPDNNFAREKAALATVRAGQDIYKRRKVLTPFIKYYEKSLNLIPANPSAEFSKEFSVILYELAQAYLKTEPKNNQAKKEKFDNLLMYYDDALFYNPGNTEAQEALKKFQEEHFTEMLEKGKNYFAKAKKQKNDLYYLNAEYYFKKANQFKPEDKETKALLVKVRKINLDKYNPDLDYPLAVLGTLVKDEYTAVQIYLVNNSADKTEIKANMFFVFDKEGNEYKGEVTDVFNATFKEGTIASGKSIEGVISFKTGGKKAKLFEKLIFESPEGMQTTKYFP